MRILQLQFKNLNSLTGEWRIDLTHPLFVSDGLFAITGPTGAGKSTLLDALCLALYGRTPRLNRVNKSGNEILSRQSGDCYAEVTFATHSGRFRCHWSQRRARNKSEGELQHPRHELVNADSGQILESNLRGVAEKVEEVTGMDFDRFTRSMLLAQGEFAKFLQASPDERAPILEQITGTGIYSEISVGVHVRRQEERKRYDLLQKELEGLEPLHPEEEGQLSARLGAAIQEEAGVSQEIALVQHGIAWLDNLARLTQELQQWEAQRQAWQEREALFAGDRTRLHRATQALELAGEYAGLTALRRAQEADRQSHGHCQAAVPAAEQAVNGAVEAVQWADALCAQSRARQQVRGEVVRQVRELDLRLREREPPIQALMAARMDQERALGGLRAQQVAAEKRREQLQQLLAEQLRQREATQGDEALVTEWAGLRERFERLQRDHGVQVAKEREVNRGAVQHREATRTWEEAAARLATQQHGLARLQADLDQVEAARRQILGAADLATWRQRLLALQERKARLEAVAAAVARRGEGMQRLAALDSRDALLDVERERLLPTLQTAVARVAVLEGDAERLEQELARLHGIQGYAEARQQLQDGVACPLCGSAEHPFAAGNVPVPGATAHALAQVRQEWKGVREAMVRGRVRAGEIDTEQAQLVLRRQEDAAQVRRAEDLLRESVPGLDLDWTGEDLAERLSVLQQENAVQWAEISRGVAAAEVWEGKRERLRRSLEQAREAVAVAERSVQGASQSREVTEQGQRRGRQEVEEWSDRVRQGLDALQQAVAVYGVEGVSVSRLEAVLGELTVRRDRWLGRQQEIGVLEQQEGVLGLEVRHRQGEIQAVVAELARQQERLAVLREERDALSRSRQLLFGDADPDVEEQGLVVAVEAADRVREDARRVGEEANRKEAQLRQRLADLHHALVLREETLREAEGAFLARLAVFSFADEADFRAASLPEEGRRALMQQARQLTEEGIGLTLRVQEKSLQREAEQQHPVTTRSREDLAQGLADGLLAQSRLQQDVGAVRQRLAENARLQERQRGVAERVAAQHGEYIRWEALHELIGSADGKKYRNFAQGLTFERMVGEANRQLQKMTDRYLLIRDPLQPLDLNVMDGYQAGEIRSTRNLSGGESFLVSLALALGLSGIASRTVRVDSLFLDEGFGTLDEESLDTALETLAGLHRDGKLIGVISHVPVFRERIAARIEVIPLAGGRSVIRGPGCMRVAG